MLENFDDSPESIILQSVIEGYNEYYSKNLRREVMKGLRENALSCRFTGGIPCLGYDIDRESLKYVVNEFEAGAVKLIFKRYLEGCGYKTIIEELNHKGFKTKKGNMFGKNSLYEILRNERYTGVYVYNKSVSTDPEGKWNRHQTKAEDDIIRIDGGIPEIISKEDFDRVQAKMTERKHKTASFKAKQVYLLSGKIVCGECGSTYAGNSRKATNRSPLYVSYNCLKKNGKVKCNNTGVKRDDIEHLVLNRLAETVFSERVLPTILDRYDEYAAGRNNEYITVSNEIQRKIKETDKGIENIVNVVVATGSAALTDKLKELEATKVQLEQALFDAQRQLEQMRIDEQRVKSAFKKAKQMLCSGTLKNRKAIVEQYVKQVVIYKDRIVVEYVISGSYTVKEEIDRKTLTHV